MSDPTSVTIPDKPAFKASEVCELAQIQPYVLRSWESEFPDLGLSKTPGGPRIYRRVDVERVLRIRDLLFIEGLTLSGVRRRFESEQPQPQDDLFTFVAEVQAAHAKAAEVKATAARAANTRAVDVRAVEVRTADVLVKPARALRPIAAAIVAEPAPAPVALPIPPPAPLPATVEPQEGSDGSPSRPPVPTETRVQIGKLKQEMRSLLDLLGGEGASAPSDPPAAAGRRSRRG